MQRALHSTHAVLHAEKVLCHRSDCTAIMYPASNVVIYCFPKPFFIDQTLFSDGFARHTPPSLTQAVSINEAHVMELIQVPILDRPLLVSIITKY